jgi:hypothetical protein
MEEKSSALSPGWYIIKGLISLHARQNLGWGKRWIGEGEESDLRTFLVNETIGILSRDYPFPGEPNRSKV